MKYLLAISFSLHVGMLLLLGCNSASTNAVVIHDTVYVHDTLVSLKPDNAKVHKGDVWVYHFKNPFEKDLKKEVVDVKDGYVQYRYVGGSMLFSSDIDWFLMNSEKIK